MLIAMDRGGWGWAPLLLAFVACGSHRRPPPGPCGYPSGRFAGTLCGSPSSPCVVRTDETLATGEASSASLAIDTDNQPTIVYRRDYESYAGVFAVRAADGWKQEPTPFDVGIAAVAIDPADVLHIMVNTGDNSDLNYTTHDAGGWKALSVLVPSGETSDGALVAPGPGCVLGAIVEVASLELAQTSGTGFALQPLSSDALSAVIALSSSGRPELSWRDAQSHQFLRTWQAPPDPPETIITPASELPQSESYIGVAGEGTDGIGEPHLLYTQGMPSFESSPGSSELVHAVRSGGVWSTATIADDLLARRCFFPSPPPPGTTCAAHDVVHAPVAVLTSDAGDVRLLFLTIERDTTLEVNTAGQVGSSTSIASSRLEMARPTGASFARTVLSDAQDATRASAAVDSNGTIHVVLSGSSLRYLALAP